MPSGDSSIQIPAKAAPVFDHRYRCTVKFSLRAQETGLAINRNGPGGPAIRRPADQHVAMMPVRPQQVQRPSMDEEGGPERALYFGHLSPCPARIRRSVYPRTRASMLIRLRAKEVMGSHVVTTRQHREARRPNVEPRPRRAVRDHHARNRFRAPDPITPQPHHQREAGTQTFPIHFRSSQIAPMEARFLRSSRCPAAFNRRPEPAACQASLTFTARFCSTEGSR